MVNRIDRCTMEILIFSDKSLSLKVKLYNENSRFRKRNQPLSKLFPSNVQKISKFYFNRTDIRIERNVRRRKNGKIVTIFTKLDSKPEISSFCDYLNFGIKCPFSTMEFSRSKFFRLEKVINYIFVLPSSINLTVFEKNEFLFDMFVF